MALQPYKDLPQEIESLKTVVELKSGEVKELRVENNQYKQKVCSILYKLRLSYDHQVIIGYQP